MPAALGAGHIIAHFLLDNSHASWYYPCGRYYDFSFQKEDSVMATPEAEWEKQWSKIVLKTWTDADFKKRLLADPTAVLKEIGVNPPPGMNVKVVENTDKVVYLPLYAKPSSGELSEEDLRQVAGAARSTCSASYWD
jgi:hypothetical protein